LALGEEAIHVVEREVGDARVDGELPAEPHLDRTTRIEADRVRKQRKLPKRNPESSNSECGGGRVPPRTLEMKAAASRRAAEAAAETEGAWWPSASRRLAIGSSAGLVNGLSRSNS
jgi:hypothetical protein